MRITPGKHLIFFPSKYLWKSSPYNQGYSVVTWNTSELLLGWLFRSSRRIAGWRQDGNMSFITWVEKTTESVSQNTIGTENTDMWLREERKLSCGNKTS